MPRIATVVFDRERIRAAVKRIMRSKQQIARAARCSDPMIWKAENAKPIGVEVAQRIATALGESLESLVAGGQESESTGAAA